MSAFADFKNMVEENERILPDKALLEAARDIFKATKGLRKFVVGADPEDFPNPDYCISYGEYRYEKDCFQDATTLCGEFGEVSWATAHGSVGITYRVDMATFFELDNRLPRNLPYDTPIDELPDVQYANSGIQRQDMSQLDSTLGMIAWFAKTILTDFSLALFELDSYGTITVTVDGRVSKTTL